MILLLEGKRDNLLLPYFELVKDKIPGLTLGKFKGLMLDKLAAQGNINNLSLGSNFYLAGATKYYFQGELTTNKRANLINGDLKTPDQWDDEACKKLNIVINILRNSFIDSVGTKYEIEEDFGNLTIGKLFRKYGKKIDAELGIQNAEKEEEDTIDRSNRVGNGYSFDILYSYDDATKYNRATSPGAWCITYGLNHYDYYRRNLNIHYVIFLKDGYENVKRQTGPGFTRQKPHDEYGNSMIAFLQRNDSWKPTYITSRWNHGYGDTSGTEADHAYTLEEFCEITGVTPQDLQRIYEIWKHDNREMVKKSSSEERAELKAASISVMRKLKYIQMMVNNGQDVFTLLDEINATREGVIMGDENNSRKCVAKYNIFDSDFTFDFITDKGNIVLDSVAPESIDTKIVQASELYCGKVNKIGSDILIFNYGKYNKIYSTRYHSFVDIGGSTKFKSVPGVSHYDRLPLFMEVKNSQKDIALVSLSTCKPLKLPNGQYWFNNIYLTQPRMPYHRRNQVISDVIYDDCGMLIDIVYDESSGEEYFYSIRDGKFVDFLKNIQNDEPLQTYSGTISPERLKPCIVRGFEMNDYAAITFSNKSEWCTTSTHIVDYRGNEISIYGNNKFANVRSVYRRFFDISDTKDRYSSSPKYLYDTKTKKIAAIGNEEISSNGFTASGKYESSERGEYVPRFIFFKDGEDEGRREYFYIYDTNKGLFIKNKNSNKSSFPISDYGHINGKDVEIFKEDGWDFWGYFYHLPDTVRDKWEECEREQRNHVIPLKDMELEYLPNNLPVNNEYSLQEKEVNQGEPAVSLRENEIRTMVENAIKKNYTIMTIIKESKRDDLLLPYLNMLKQKGINVGLGAFKGIMLDKLGAQGGMHNLSKSSNFYLAGATRYYFNGDLTIGTPALLSDNPDGQDEWNTEVCKRLDALIDILRTAYIDSVGEAFEQPEDFGNLPIAKLLKKYNKKINVYLGIDDGTSKSKKEGGNEIIDTRVGNGYSFHILYSYPEGTKYERFTAPGAWCITYGKNHYDMYVRRLNIHYVIFLKDGYENVKRKTGPGFTKQKPHDEYGNSMIALLQSNVDGKPVYITSRWNHGYGETSGTEADHAYTPEEFYNITGVTPEDLQRIFQIWKKEAPKHKENGRKTVDPAEKARKLENLRSLKYIQMRINGGEDPNALLKPYQMLYGKMPERDEDGVVRQKVDFRKCVLICSPMPQGEERPREYFLVDKGQIIFETISEGRPQWDFTMMPAEKFYQNRYGAQDASDERGVPHNLIIFKGNGGGYGLYDTRKHAFITVGSTKRFKSIPNKWSDTGAGYMPQFFQVKMSMNDIALISLSNNMPLKLPNGEYWFNDMKSNTIKGNSESYYRSLDSYFAGTLEDGLIEIIYDISSGEKYFYSTSQKKFVDLSYILQYVGDDNLDNLYLNTKVRRKILGKYDAVTTMRGTDRWNIGPTMFIDGAGQIEKLGEFDKFGDFDEQGRLLCIAPVEKKENGNWGTINDGVNKRVVFNKEKGLVLKSGGNYVFVQGISQTYSDSPYAVLSQYIRDENNRSWTDCKLLYDIDSNAMLKNPFGYPSDYLFEAAGVHGRGFMRVYKKPHRTFGWSERDTRNTEFAECVSDVYYDELEKTPLDDNNEQGNEYRVDNRVQAAPAQALAETISLDEIKFMVNEAIRRIRDGK